MRTIIFSLFILLCCSPAMAAPYEFTQDLDAYTWGEPLSRVKDSLGEPYSQDPGGVTYLMSGTWMKQVLIHEDQVYQLIERVIYSLEDPAAEKEYNTIKQRLISLYGPPGQEDISCPNPQPQVKCKISRWDNHPQTQVFLVLSQDKAVSVMLGVTSRQLREEALNNRENLATLSIGQVIGAYQQNSQAAADKYGGQDVKIMGQAGGLVKDQDGRLYMRVHNAFNNNQRIHCYLPADYGSMGPPPEGAVVVEGTVGNYKNNILVMEPCTLYRPPE